MNAANLTRRDLARHIDHTLLKPEATADQIRNLCAEAQEFAVAAVCVNPVWVRMCAQQLAGSAVQVCAVAGFPLGASLSATKADEARRAIDEGATEVDMVIHMGALRAGDTDTVQRDVSAVVTAVAEANPRALVKVILETAALSNEEIRAACACCVAAQADFLKTSTGFHASGGATIEHVRLLAQHADGLRVKAAGGIRSLADARAMLEAGADRLGMSATGTVLAEIA